MTFSGDDGNGCTDTATTLITVNDVGPGNECPTVTAPTTQTVNEGSLLSFTVTASDPDGDTVVLSATDLPSGTSFGDNLNNTGTFTWTPGSLQSGTYSVTFSGDDGNGCTDTATTLITVNDVPPGNECPTVTAPATQTVNEGSLLSFTVTASDPDGDTVVLSATDLPSGAASGDNLNNTGTFTWTPGSLQSGTYSVTFSGDDGNGCTDTATTLITVNDVGPGNECPTVTAPATQTVNEGQALNFTVTATDPDGDSVDLSASDLPAGATFNDNDNNSGSSRGPQASRSPGPTR